MPGVGRAPDFGDVSCAERNIVEIVSGSFGAGHDAAAREIGVLLHSVGCTTRTWDIVDLFPWGLGKALRAVYLRQLRSASGSWGAVLSHLERPNCAYRMATRAMGLTAGGLLDIVGDRTRMVISTHPFASQALGQLRSSGKLPVPVVTYLTDMSVHPLWVHSSVDMHLALHQIPATQALRHGGSATVIEPVVPLTYANTRRAGATHASRRSLGLPLNERLVLVTGGAHGIGSLESTAEEIAATGLARPVVLCGHNTRLRRRLQSREKFLALGWRDDLPQLLAAMDCVVQNAGGFTSLEALASGVPVLSYRCIPGHGQTNAQALEDSGLVPWARSPNQLRVELERALDHDSRPKAPGSRAPAPNFLDALFPKRARVPA